MRIYIVGICGTFMGGLARIAVECGHQVGGCDAMVYPPMSIQLEKIGIQVDSGYELASINSNWDCFVIGNALSRGNPLVEEILRRRLPFVSGPEWLAREVLKGRRVLAVSGTHGKTTTTAMLSWILECAGLTPGFLVGGVPINFDISSRAGDAQSTCFVIEADEYDTAFFDKRPKFIHYHPEVLVLNNLEFDHADIYEDLDAIKQQFHFLLRTVPSDGVILYHANDLALREVLDMGVWTPCESFSWGGNLDDADWVGEIHGDGFRLFYKGRQCGDCHWAILGSHNVANALGAVAAAYHAGVELQAALNALADFQGVQRRLEIKAESSGIVVYDDFAHHPSAIRTTLEAVEAKKAKDGRILAVFEPCSNTMKMGCHNQALAQAFTAADKVFCYRPSALGEVIDAAISKIRSPISLLFFDDSESLFARLKAEVKAGDHVVFMSNGGFCDLPTRFANSILESQT